MAPARNLREYLVSKVGQCLDTKQIMLGITENVHGLHPEAFGCEWNRFMVSIPCKANQAYDLHAEARIILSESSVLIQILLRLVESTPSTQMLTVRGINLSLNLSLITLPRSRGDRFMKIEWLLMGYLTCDSKSSENDLHDKWLMFHLRHLQSTMR